MGAWPTATVTAATSTAYATTTAATGSGTCREPHNLDSAYRAGEFDTSVPQEGKRDLDFLLCPVFVGLNGMEELSDSLCIY